MQILISLYKDFIKLRKKEYTFLLVPAICLIVFIQATLIIGQSFPTFLMPEFTQFSENIAGPTFNFQYITPINLIQNSNDPIEFINSLTNQSLNSANIKLTSVQYSLTMIDSIATINNISNGHLLAFSDTQLEQITKIANVSSISSLKLNHAWRIVLNNTSYSKTFVETNYTISQSNNFQTFQANITSDGNISIYTLEDAFPYINQTISFSNLITNPDQPFFICGINTIRELITQLTLDNFLISNYIILNATLLYKLVYNPFTNTLNTFYSRLQSKSHEYNLYILITDTFSLIKTSNDFLHQIQFVYFFWFLILSPLIFLCWMIFNSAIKNSFLRFKTTADNILLRGTSNYQLIIVFCLEIVEIFLLSSLIGSTIVIVLSKIFNINISIDVNFLNIGIDPNLEFIISILFIQFICICLSYTINLFIIRSNMNTNNYSDYFTNKKELHQNNMKNTNIGSKKYFFIGIIGVLLAIWIIIDNFNIFNRYILILYIGALGLLIGISLIPDIFRFIFQHYDFFELKKLIPIPKLQFSMISLNFSQLKSKIRLFSIVIILVLSVFMLVNSYQFDVDQSLIYNVGAPIKLSTNTYNSTLLNELRQRNDIQSVTVTSLLKYSNFGLNTQTGLISLDIYGIDPNTFSNNLSLFNDNNIYKLNADPTTLFLNMKNNTILAHKDFLQNQHLFIGNNVTLFLKSFLYQQTTNISLTIIGSFGQWPGFITYPLSPPAYSTTNISMIATLSLTMSISKFLNISQTFNYLINPKDNFNEKSFLSTYSFYNPNVAISKTDNNIYNYLFKNLLLFIFIAFCLILVLRTFYESDRYVKEMRKDIAIYRCYGLQIQDFRKNLLYQQTLILVAIGVSIIVGALCASAFWELVIVAIISAAGSFLIVEHPFGIDIQIVVIIFVFTICTSIIEPILIFYRLKNDHIALLLTFDD